MRTVQIPSEIVKEDFKMDPESMSLVLGDELRAGMVVLLDSSLHRASFTDVAGNSQLLLLTPQTVNVLTTSRWCRVEKIQRVEDGQDLITFVGVYADGTQAVRTYHRKHAWVVLQRTKDAHYRRESLPKAIEALVRKHYDRLMQTRSEIDGSRVLFSSPEITTEELGSGKQRIVLYSEVIISEDTFDSTIHTNPAYW